MSEVRVIKKYANRRLYDATQSRHITVEDIRRLIVAGERIKVVKDKTGEDITRIVLLQVIAEQEQFGRPILSTPLLEALIREAADHPADRAAGIPEGDDRTSVGADDVDVSTVLRSNGRGSHEEGLAELAHLSARTPG